MSIKSIGLLCAVAACLVNAGCKGGDNSSNSPVGPSNSTKVTGGWTGTLTRPGGQVLTVKWDVGLAAGAEGEQLNGPMTITGTSASTTALAKGITAGNDKNGYSIFLQFSDTTPTAACSVKASSAGSSSGGGDPYPSPYTEIKVPSLQIFVNGQCQGIFDGAGTFNVNIQEFARLTLVKN